MKAAADELPRFIRDMIAAGPPKAGTGVNNWLFRMARVLHAFRSTDEIAELLRASTADCGRTITEKEIARQIESSRSCAWQPGALNPETARRTHAWPEFDEGLWGRTITQNGLGLAELFERSPYSVEELETEEVIDALFPSDCWLCCGRTKSDFLTLRRRDWRGMLAGMQFIVPSPMTQKFGVTAEGKKSQHTLANTGPRRFLVIEQDKGTLDEQAAILLHLEVIAPLTLAVFSGGKSIHGWFYCAGQQEKRLEAFMRVACTLGADPATWLRSQFVRMPCATRNNGQLQTIYFFNPGALR